MPGERILRGLRHPPLRARRLATFVALSGALHVLTLVSIPPSGVASAPDRGAAPLQATLTAAAPAKATAGEPLRNDTAPTTSDQQHTAAERSPDPTSSQPRAGIDAGVDLPLPDKWYAATEVDVRAEPLDPIRLDYPAELEGTGIPGKVRVVLFIDERGVVTRMQVADAEPARLFDKAAMAPWPDVRFSPALKNGVPVKSRKLLELDFSP